MHFALRVHVPEEHARDDLHAVGSVGRRRDREGTYGDGVLFVVDVREGRDVRVDVVREGLVADLFAVTAGVSRVSGF